VCKKLEDSRSLIRDYRNNGSEIRAQGLGYINTKIAKLAQRTMDEEQYEKLLNATPEQIAKDFSIRKSK